MTELQQSQTNGVPATEQSTSTLQAEGNVAAERWDANTGAEKDAMEESYEIVPRPNDEVDIPAAAPIEASQQQQTTSWADEPAAGNLAGESWDTKAPGQEAAADTSAPTNGAADDGFHEVPGRTRGGRGGNRGRGEGQSRGGRGGRGRGGPFRGNRGDGNEGRNRGGRGRGPRGDGNAPARS